MMASPAAIALLMIIAPCMATSIAPDLPLPNGACYEDNVYRILPVHIGDFSNNQKSVCIAACAGYKYAGVQYSTQCFCGNDKPAEYMITPEDCTTDCPGNDDEKCGGTWRMNIYEVRTLLDGTCYEDSSDRILPVYAGDFYYNEKTVCIAECAKRGYRYAGVQYEIQCFCGDEMPLKSLIRPADCTTACPGNSAEMCGGTYRMNVYKVDPLPNGICYEDNEDRILPVHIDNFVYTNSKSVCIAACVHAGYKYAGVQYYYQCFCGNDQPDNDLIRPDECEMTCPGNDNEKCGDTWRMNVYQVPVEPDGICYEDNEDRILPYYIEGDFTETNQMSVCIAACAKDYYKYAGVQYGHQCFCGDEKPENNLIRPTDCNNECPGNENEKCGDSWRMNVYTVAIEDGGCYEDNPQRILPLHFGDFEYNSPYTCISACQGYRYAGVQYTNQCFCGDDKPHQSLARPGECNAICPGDDYEHCGGTWRMNIYEVEQVDLYDGQCYEDTPDRVLPVYIGDFSDNSESVCKAACDGYEYAGVQYTNQCFCGNDLPHNSLVREGECNAVCPGTGNTNSIYCGGTWRMNVYKV